MSPHFTRVVKTVFGYKNVKYMVAGHKTWQEGINAYLTEPEFVKMVQDEGIAHILVDLRSAEKAGKGHIKGAVNFPADKDFVEAAQDLNDTLPQEHKKDARIIYYSDDPEVAENMMKTMRANYWENGYILNGGIQSWQEKGYPLQKGTPADEITYKGKKTLPGAMSIPDYEKIAKATPADTIIVDVRSPSEWTRTGIIPGALTLPIDTLHRRYTEIPKGKKIIVQCAAGNRALQAWRLLKDRGYKNVSWVDGHVKKYSKGILQQGHYGKTASR